MLITYMNYNALIEAHNSELTTDNCKELNSYSSTIFLIILGLYYYY
jgi:hypothetical protein